MEQRIAKLETDVGEIKDILKRLEPALTKLAVDMAEMKGRMVGIEGRMIGIEGQLRQMPTLWSMGGTMLAINAGIVAVAGLVVSLLR